MSELKLTNNPSPVATPEATRVTLYAVGDQLYYKNDAGVETGPLGAAPAYWFEKGFELIHTTGSVEITGSLSSGLNAYALGGYSQAYGSHTFTTDQFSPIDTVNTMSNEVTVFNDSYFSPGDIVAYIDAASGNNNSLHIAEVIQLIGGNVIELSSVVPIAGSAFNAISENEPGAISVLINLSNGNSGADYSHAEGSYTIASGINSHAEGRKTAAVQAHSHAEGVVTLASGVGSHAEGEYTIAAGDRSHAEGSYTRAYGDFSHAEGQDSIAGYSGGFSGNGSHAEGSFTIAAGGTSHAEGESTRTGYTGFFLSDDVAKVDVISQAPNFVYAIDDQYSDVTSEFSGLNRVYVNDDNSDQRYVYGLVGQSYDSLNSITYVTASDDFKMGVPGTPNIIAAYDSFNPRQDQPSANISASGYSAHSEGALTTALGSYTHSEGYLALAVGAGSHAEGGSTVATGEYSHAEGEDAQALGYGSHAEGNNTIALGNYSHAEGIESIAIGESAHAEGSGTRAGLLGYDIVGAPDLISDAPRAIYQINLLGIDVTQQFVSRPDVILGNNLPYTIYDQNFDGSYTYVTASNTSGWGGYPSYGPIAPIDSAVPGAYDVPIAADVPFSSQNAHAEGKFAIAIGAGSHAEGFSTYTAGDYSHAEGFQTVTSGTASHAEGINTIARGEGSHAEGAQTKAIGDASHAGGVGTIASGSGQTVIGAFNVKGNDTSIFVIGDGKFGAFDGPGADGRSDIVRVNTGSTAGTGQVEVTGSLSVSGSQSILHHFGGYRYFPTIVTSLPYTASSYEYVVGVSASAGPGVELNAAGNFGQTFIVKDVSGSATADNISVTAAGGELINGQSSYTINSDFGSAQFVYFGPSSGWGTV